MTTMQEEQKAHVRFLLERMWSRYQARLRGNNHELVILAVPTYPANIEAVSALDLQDVADLLATFSEHRKVTSHEHELEPIKPEGDATSRQAREAFENIIQPAYQDGNAGLALQAIDGQVAAAVAQSLGQGNDGGGASQERVEPAPEPHEGDAAAGTVEKLSPAIQGRRLFNSGE